MFFNVNESASLSGTTSDMAISQSLGCFLVNAAFYENSGNNGDHHDGMSTFLPAFLDPSYYIDRYFPLQIFMLEIRHGY